MRTSRLLWLHVTDSDIGNLFTGVVGLDVVSSDINQTMLSTEYQRESVSVKSML